MAIGEGGRLGPMARASQLLPEGTAAKSVAGGLSYLDPALRVGGKAAGGAATGMVVGGTLGALAEGLDSDAMWQGMGGGFGLGGVGGTLHGALSHVSGATKTRRAANDLDGYESHLIEVGRETDAAQLRKARSNLGDDQSAVIMADALAFAEAKGTRVVWHDNATRPDDLPAEIDHTGYEGLVPDAPIHGQTTLFLNSDNITNATAAHEVFHTVMRSHYGLSLIHI